MIKEFYNQNDMKKTLISKSVQKNDLDTRIQINKGIF